MDALRLADLSSRDRFVSGVSSPREGRKLVRKHNKSRSLSSDSSSCHFNTLAGDTLAFEPGWKSAHQTVGMPMRSLLAQEMSKQSESKRRSPSIIARLMGLDGLPPHNSSHRQHKYVENHQQRMRATEKAHRGSTSDGPSSFRRSSKDEQEFKDVFEVLETPKVESSRYLYQGWENANLTEAEMAFIRQKFMEAKRLSTDEKFHHSKEFHDALEALDSNKDLLLKFLQHPDSLFTKHVHDLQNIVLERHCCQVPSTKSSNRPKHVDGVKAQKADREGLRRSRRSPHKYGTGGNPSHSHSRHVAYNNKLDLPKEELAEKSGLQPTRIVVLKPNLGKIQNADRTLSTPSSSPDDFRADCRLPCTSNWESEVWGKQKAYEDVSLSRHKSRESRGIARTITRQMRTSWGKDGSMNFQASGFRGYAGDESSSGSDSASELELVPVTSRTRTTFNRKNHHRSLSSRSTESSVSREAKKRLSERWKLAHKSEQEREICRRSTLAEMLAISDREARPASFNGIVFDEGLSKRFDFEDSGGRSESPEPLGISSRDGWKGSCTRNSLKPRTTVHHESPRDYRIVIPKEVTKRDGVKGSSSNHGESFSSNNSRPGSNKSQSSYDTSPEININPIPSKVLYMDDGLLEQKLFAFKTHTSFSVDVNSDTENVSNSEDTKISSSSEPSNPDLSATTSVTDPASGHDILRSQDILGGSPKEIAHSSVPELHSRASTKEADQPSPVSVLEPSFPDDFSSSSECFESLSADLQGLRMQLQLLKLESGAYGEGSMLVSSDEDADQEESFRLTDEKMNTEEHREDWKCLYLVDVLANSRFSDSDPDTFMATWHSSESPVSPSLFEELEKKYSGPISSTRSERKFLFDRINSELLQIFHQSTDPHPWLKPTRVSPKWDVNRLQDTLRKLVTRKDEKPRREAREKVLEKESQWLSLEDDIEVIGWEIEKLLTDELIAELVVTI